jgi:hypothetical protein
MLIIIIMLPNQAIASTPSAMHQMLSWWYVSHAGQAAGLHVSTGVMQLLAIPDPGPAEVSAFFVSPAGVWMDACNAADAVPHARLGAVPALCNRQRSNSGKCSR